MLAPEKPVQMGKLYIHTWDVLSELDMSYNLTRIIEINFFASYRG